MSDFLTRRSGTWHFVRRVPTEYASLDRRGIVRHSTRVKIADDRVGRRAGFVAITLNRELELFWKGLAEGQANANLDRYNGARRRARSLGFEYLPSADVLLLPQEKRLERLEALLAKGLANDPTAREAVLGTAQPCSIKLSHLFDEYEEVTQHEVKDLSPDQLRIWRNGRSRAVERFVALVGDKPLSDLTHNDAIDYSEWWRDRLLKDGVAAKTANKDIGQLSRTLKEINIRRRLNLPDIFKGLHLRGETDKSRLPYDPAFIQGRFLGGALRDLNEDARFVLYVMIETGLRPPSPKTRLSFSPIRKRARRTRPPTRRRARYITKLNRPSGRSSMRSGAGRNGCSLLFARRTGKEIYASELLVPIHVCTVMILAR